MTLRLFLLQPETIFAARTNMASVVYPLDTLTFDTVTTGAYGNVVFGQTLLLGSSAGADDLGRTRVRGSATATTIPIGRVSRGTRDGELDVADNMYVTVVNDYRVWSKIPVIDNDITQYKDSAIAVGTYTSGDEPPVANAGVPAMGTIDATTSKFRTWMPHVANSSFAVADGATITGYAWILPTGVTLVAGSALTDSAIQVDCDPGFYWLVLTVTDSNGNTHTARTWIFARDPAADVTIDAFEITSHRWMRQGQTLSVKILEDIPAATYPDGTLVAVMDGEPSSGISRANLLFWGWHQSDPTEIQATRTAVLAGTVLDCVDVAGRLDSLPGFPQAVYSDAHRDTTTEPAITWSYMVDPTVDKLLHYLLHWHSTALEVADWTWSGTGATFPFAALICNGESIFDQVNRKCQALCPDHYFVCDRFGRLAVRVDPMLQDVADRTATVQTAVTDAYWGQIRYSGQRPPRAHWSQASAIKAQAEWPLDSNGRPIVTTYWSWAPGLSPGQGEQLQTHGEQLALSQAQLNAVTGHRYARANAPHSYFQISAAGYDYTLVDPAAMTWVEVSIPAAVAAQRGLNFLTDRGLVHEMTIRYEHTRTGTVRTADLLWERETSGPPAVTYVPPDAEPVDDGNDYWYIPPATTPPDDGLVGGVAVVALLDSTGNLFRTDDFQTASGAGGPTWDKVDLGTGALYSWVVDPFSPGYVAGAGTINGWAVDETAIYRIADIFGATPTATAVHTFAVANVAASYHWRTLQASFGRYFAEGSNPWLLCISYYGATTGHTGTWATYSIDGGVTWAAEVQVSAFYDTTLAAANPIGVYASPKTPGLGYTAAYYATAAPAPADGYVTTDWGATWTRLSADPVDDPAEPLPRWGVWDQEAGTFTLGALGGSASLEVAVHVAPLEGTTTEDKSILLGPPVTAKRVVIAGAWHMSIAETGTVSTQGHFFVDKPASVAMVDDLTEPLESSPGSWSGTWTATYTYTGGDWPGNKDTFVSSPPTGRTQAVHFDPYASAGAVGAGESADVVVGVTVRITEIELDDGTIYTPPVAGAGMIQPIHGQAGSIHLPWPDNAAEEIAYYGAVDRLSGNDPALMRALGGVPAVSNATYGVQRGPFGVRTFDGDRQYAAFAGWDGSQYALLVSSDAGASWAVVHGPTAAAAAHPTEIAFGGNTQNVLFAWGTGGTILYSSNFGTALDSRIGNLATINGGTAPALLIGICGGPG